MSPSSTTAAGVDVQAQDREEISRQVRAASTSFYGAMRILGRDRREAIFAIYAFCRAVDDVADDEGMTREERAQHLSQWRQDIDALYAGKPANVICRALSGPIETYHLKQEDFIAVIDGMQMDADGPVIAPTWVELDLYCDRVASAVGRLCVCIFGEPEPRGREVAQHLGRALQLTNILRDVHEDGDIGRLYLPRELLQKHGIQYSAPASVVEHDNYAQVWRAVSEKAEQAFVAAAATMKYCDRRKIRPARIMMEVYRRNLHRMQALSDSELANPGVSKRLVGKAEKILIALQFGLL